MWDVDKFGTVIYRATFDTMLKYGDILSNFGYLESGNKPNLFYKALPQGWLYADLRGTKEVRIWQDPRPLFYWNFDTSTPIWQRIRILKKELSSLHKKGCPCRISFLTYETSEEFQQTDAFYWEDKGVLEGADGHCRVCGKDFRDDGWYCSPKCEHKYSESLKKTCEVCGETIERSQELEHHIAYFPHERFMIVHRGCHQKIHKSDQFPHLKPSQEDIDRFYAPKREARAAREKRKREVLQPDEHGHYHCYRCKAWFLSIDDMKSHLTIHEHRQK